MTLPTQEAIEAALERVIDPEIRRPVTQLGMVRSIDIADDGAVTIGLNLTVAGCPLKDTLTADTQREVGAVAGVTSVKVELGVMNDEERAARPGDLAVQGVGARADGGGDDDGGERRGRGAALVHAEDRHEGRHDDEATADAEESGKKSRADTRRNDEEDAA